ncbi:hypothetical protein RFI_07141, partial [Reticulomyxa filosa]
SHLFYEHIRAWKPNNSEEEAMKQASDETLAKINDITCEWISDKEIKKIAKRFQSYLDIGILKSSQLFNKSETEINSNVELKMAQFVYEQLDTFTLKNEKVKEKEQAIYVVLYEYYKKNIIGNEEKEAIGEIKPGINLLGYCTHETCLSAKEKFYVWVNIGFGDISLTSDNTLYHCPECLQLSVTSIARVKFFNSEYSIFINNDPVYINKKDYEGTYPIKPGLTYSLKAERIRQRATSIGDLIIRSEAAMNSEEVLNLVAELQKYMITVAKPPKVKDMKRLLEKIDFDYGGDYNRVFDVGRFTILCDNCVKLQTALNVIKKANKFNLIVSEDKDSFNNHSTTHYRFHNTKLYVPKYDVYVEMQATLKHYTTLEGHTLFSNPKLSHLFYEHIRAWKPNNSEEEAMKQASDETLAKINDITCEWISDKEIKKIAKRFQSYLDIEINSNVELKMAQFVYKQLDTFILKNEKVKEKEQAIYVVLYEYYKKNIIGNEEKE